MPTLSVLFERTPEPAAIGEALRAAGGDWEAGEGDEARAILDGLRVRVRLRGGPVRGHGVVEAAASGGWRGSTEAIARCGAHVSLECDALDAPERAIEVMTRLTRLATVLLSLPGALALFADEGHVLSAPGAVDGRLGDRRGRPPLELWVALRTFELADARGWFLDTLGMEQLRLPDLEAYAADGAATERAGAWLRNIGLYLAQEGAAGGLHHGDTLDGPDDQIWTTVEDSATAPPSRRVLRFEPLDRRPAQR